MLEDALHYTLYFYGAFIAALLALLALLFIIDGLIRLACRAAGHPVRPYEIDLDDLRPLGNARRLDRHDG